MRFFAFCKALDPPVFGGSPYFEKKHRMRPRDVAVTSLRPPGSNQSEARGRGAVRPQLSAVLNVVGAE